MIAQNINNIISDIPENVKLIAISKTKPNEDIMTAYKNGHRFFGENKIQEMSRKYVSNIFFGHVMFIDEFIVY